MQYKFESVHFLSGKDIPVYYGKSHCFSILFNTIVVLLWKDYNRVPSEDEVSTIEKISYILIAYSNLYSFILIKQCLNQQSMF